MQLNFSNRLAYFLDRQWILSVVILLTITAFPLSAQVDRAVLEGTVSDPSGAEVVGALIKTRAVETGIEQEQRTNANGYYRISGLAPGRYSLTAVKDGFKTRVIDQVVLE